MFSLQQLLVISVCVTLTCAYPSPPPPAQIEGLEQRGDDAQLDALAETIAGLLHLGAGIGVTGALAACQAIGNKRDIFLDMAVRTACAILQAIADNHQ